MVSKRKSNSIAAVITLLVLALIFALLWFSQITWQEEERLEDGIEVAFGNMEEGGGSQPIESEAVPLPEQPNTKPTPAASDNDMLVQEHTPSLALPKPEDEQKKKQVEQQAREQAAIAKANQLGSLFGNNGSNVQGSGHTEGVGQQGVPVEGHGTSGGHDWSLKGRSLLKALPLPSNDFTQEGTVVVAIIVDTNGKVVSAKATTGTTISNDATIQLAIKAAYKAEFSFTDRPDKQFGTITYHFKFK